jgi:DNA modification methylase
VSDVVEADWPATEVSLWELSRLSPYEKNPRLHTAAQVEQIAASIREWGFTIPLLADEAGVLIAGHARLAAAKSLNLLRVPVMVARNWSEAQKRAYVIADNQLASTSEWSMELLTEGLHELGGWGMDLGLLGFESAELQALMEWGPGRPEGKTDPDSVPEIATVPISCLGDVWTLGKHRIACGDSTDALVIGRLLGDVKPPLMVTDPPYGVEYDPMWRDDINRGTTKMRGVVDNDDRADWREAWALFPGDVAYVWHAGKFAATVQASLEANAFDIRSQIIWAKSRFTLSRGDYHWQHEPCWYAVRKGSNGHWAGDRKQSTLWEIAGMHTNGGSDDTTDDKVGHGTQKPVECMRRPINNNSKPGQAVYDPFLGSGTTLIAAEQTGRICYACELNPLYADMSIRRWQAFTGEAALLEGDGRSFATIELEREATTAPAEATV